MPKRCVYGTCNSDARYPERLDGGKVKFIPFPKPKTNMQKCMEWIKLCGRPREQLNPDKITSNYYVCTKHFVDPSGPTPKYPDPVSADPHSTAPRPSRPKPAKRLCLEKDKVLSHSNSTESTTEEPVCEMINLAFTDSETTQANSHTISEVIEQVVTCDSSTQTSDNWIDPLDFFSLSAELSSLRNLVAEQHSTINSLSDAREMQNKIKLLQNVLDKQNKELNAVKKELKAVKDVYPRCEYKKVNKNSKLMKFYTGFSAVTFAAICSFFIPDGDVPFVTTKEKKVFKTLTPQNQLFFCFLKLRHNFEFQDLACRFGISVQAASTLFSSWINYLYLRCGEVTIWPHRDVILNHMPEGHRKDFPTTFGILDCTELKLQKPRSLKAQSQTYSDYKSTNTLKGLVACDPRGSIIFSSMLFSGSMSDKEIFVQSGLKETLTELIEIGYLHVNDGLMADKGFNIEEEVKATGLRLNIPPFAKASAQMSQADAIETKRIAKHRVHVERAIQRIKRFQILKHQIPLSLYSSITQIWYVCSFLTNFMPPCIKYS